MRRLHSFSIRHPIPVLVVAALAILAAAPGIFRLRLRTDGNALVPSHAPEVKLDQEIRRAFGIGDPLVVLIRPRHPDGIFNPSTLHLVADLTSSLGGIPGLGVSNVRSLATEVSDHFRPGELTYRRLLEPVPESPAQLDTLRGDLEAIQILTGTLVSSDGEAATILLDVPPQGDRRALLARVDSVIARADTTGHEVHVIGAPVAEAILGSHILRDLGISWGSPSRLNARTASVPGAGAMSRLRAAVAEHLGLLPLSIAVMALVFILCFRSLTAALIPLAEAAACLVFVLGLMGWTGIPVYLTMAVLPVILVSLGLADEIHVFSAYSRQRMERPDEPVARTVRTAMDEMCFPVVATAVTTAIGFLSFAVSPLAPVRAFGWFTAVGIVFCMLWTLTVIPAMLVLLGPRGFHGLRRRATDRSRSASARGSWNRWAGLTARRPVLTLAAVAFALAFTPLGIRRVVVQDSWISGFARDSEFFRATEYFNRHFFGAHMLLLALDTGHTELSGSLKPDDLDYNGLRLPGELVPDPAVLEGCALVVTRVGSAAPPGPMSAQEFRPGSWESVVESAERRDGTIVIHTPPVHGSARFLLAPDSTEELRYTLDSRRLALPGVLALIGDFEDFIRSQSRYTVGGVLGPTDQIETAEFLTNDRVAGARAIPRNPDRVLWLWNAIQEVQGQERKHEVVDARLEHGLVRVFLKNANFIDTARLMDALRGYERDHLAPRHIRFDFAGDVEVSQTLIRTIVRSQVGSLVGSALGIVIVTALLFRSLRRGLLCMVPAALSIAVAFAVMGWTGMPLGVATSMFASMVLGIGVDFAIHVVERYRVLAAQAQDRLTAIGEALAATGPAVVINALAVACGFGILVLSEVPANARLGAITVVCLLSCLAATLLVIPALLGMSAMSTGGVGGGPSRSGQADGGERRRDAESSPASR